MSVIQAKDLLQKIRKGDLDAVTTIINKHGLSYAKEWAGGYVLLREAIKSKQSKIANMLLKQGAEINPRNKGAAYTPLHWAIKNNDAEMVDILLKKKANCNTKGGNGITPLHSAVFVGNVNIVKSLLNANVSVNVIDRFGISATESAINQGKAKILKVLLQKEARVRSKSSYGVNALHLGAMSGEELIVRRLLNDGANINSVIFEEKPGYTPLHGAAANGHEEIVKLLLSRGAHIDRGTEETYTPLHVATINRHGSIVRLLLLQGGDPNVRDKHGRTILNIALENHDLATIKNILEFLSKTKKINHEKCVRDVVCKHWQSDETFCKVLETLREYGFTVCHKDAQDSKLLHATVEKGCLEILEDLLKLGADDSSISSSQTCNTLLHTTVKNKQFEAAKILINKNANVNARAGGNTLPIWCAIENVDVDMVKLLLDNGTDLKGRHDLLHKALTERSKEIVEMILKHNPEIGVNVKDACGCTALHYANFSTRWRRLYTASNTTDTTCYLIKLLLSQGAYVNVQDNLGITPLHSAVENEQLEVIKILLEHNANMECVTKYEEKTPLHCAVHAGKEMIIKMLLEKGAKINAQRKDGRTSLHIACNKGYKNIVSMLLEYGAKIDSRDSNDMMPLQIAVMNGSLQIVQVLLNNFADVDTQDSRGITLLHVATKRGLPEIVEELLTYGANVNVTCNDGHTPLHYALCRGIRNNNGEHGPRRRSNLLQDFSSDSDSDEREDDYYGGRLLGRDNDYYRDDDDDDDDYSSTNSYRLNEVARILESYIVKIRALNMPVNEWDSDTIDDKTELVTFHNKCKYEIDMMMNGKISDTNVSLHDLLTKDINQLAMYTRNQSIVETLELNDYHEIFPIYCNMIRNNFRKAQNRESLIDSGLRSLNFLSQFPLPDTWSLELMTYLSNKDLRSLTKAGCNDDSNMSIG